MTAFVFLFSVQVLSALIAVWTVRRLYGYIRLYRFDESVYTLLFGFLHLKYFVALYVATIFFAVLVELIYAFSFLSS